MNRITHLARERLERVTRALAAHDAELMRLRANADVDGRERAYAAAVQALKDYPFHAAMAGEEVSASRTRELAQSVRLTGKALEDARLCEQKAQELSETRAVLVEAQAEAVRAVVEAEGLAVAALLRKRERQAQQARETVGALVDWAQENCPAVAARIDLAVSGAGEAPRSIEAGMNRQGESERAESRTRERYRNGWLAAARALLNRPDATGPDPDEVNDAA